MDKEKDEVSAFVKRKHEIRQNMAKSIDAHIRAICPEDASVGDVAEACVMAVALIWIGERSKTEAIRQASKTFVNMAARVANDVATAVRKCEVEERKQQGNVIQFNRKKSNGNG